MKIKPCKATANTYYYMGFQQAFASIAEITLLSCIKLSSNVWAGTSPNICIEAARGHVLSQVVATPLLPENNTRKSSEVQWEPLVFVAFVVKVSERHAPKSSSVLTTSSDQLFYFILK